MPEIVANMVQVHPFRVRNGTIEHLLLRRSRLEAFGAGVWQVITGVIEPGERSFEAARRELAEETGLNAELWIALPGVAVFFFEPADQMILSPMFACQLPANCEPLLSEEHSEYAWLPREMACSHLVYPTHIQGLNEVEAHGIVQI
ncbi:MAG TPA: NUDIX domain-containing protein [Candidatus Kapabacteria bacterium]|nr:NUDIX domain-containing protein [Candidatus Kapabacteria bacterium]